MPVLNRLHTLYHTTEDERTNTGHLKQYAFLHNDLYQAQTTDIKTCFNLDEDGNPISPRTEQGHIADLLTDGQEQTYFFQLVGPFSSLNSLLLNNLEFSLTLYFSGTTTNKS